MTTHTDALAAANARVDSAISAKNAAWQDWLDTRDADNPCTHVAAHHALDRAWRELEAARAARAALL